VILDDSQYLAPTHVILGHDESDAPEPTITTLSREITLDIKSAARPAVRRGGPVPGIPKRPRLRPCRHMPHDGRVDIAITPSRRKGVDGLR
jgi:hypothetical protein